MAIVYIDAVVALGAADNKTFRDLIGTRFTATLGEPHNAEGGYAGLVTGFVFNQKENRCQMVTTIGNFLYFDGKWRVGRDIDISHNRSKQYLTFNWD